MEGMLNIHLLDTESKAINNEKKYNFKTIRRIVIIEGEGESNDDLV